MLSRDWVADFGDPYRCWYRRSELGFRAALFFSAAALAGSFGGLLAAAITNMDGVGGYEGWRWICEFRAFLSQIFGKQTSILPFKHNSIIYF